MDLTRIGSAQPLEKNLKNCLLWVIQVNKDLQRGEMANLLVWGGQDIWGAACSTGSRVYQPAFSGWGWTDLGWPGLGLRQKPGAVLAICPLSGSRMLNFGKVHKSLVWTLSNWASSWQHKPHSVQEPPSPAPRTARGQRTPARKVLTETSKGWVSYSTWKLKQ